MKRQEIPEWFSKLRVTEKKELLWNFDVADEEKFYNVFMACGDKGIRMMAVGMTEDQDRLWYCAVHDEDADVRSAATIRLTDSDRLLSIVRNDPDRKVRTSAAAVITDREILYKLASNDTDRWIRKAAISALKEDDDLMRIVFSDREENELRLLAAKKIRDQECLKYIINSTDKLSSMDHHNAISNSADVRTVAVGRIDDHEMLRKIAADYDERRAVRVAAVSKLGENDQDIFEMIAMKPYDPDPRINPDLYYEPEMKAAAVARLTDKDLLRGYLDDNEKETRAAARLALGEADILKETVTDSSWPVYIRKRAFRQIKDQDFCFDFAMHHVCGNPEEAQVAATAVGRVFDPKRLAELVVGAEEYLVSETAIKSINDDDQLLRIITEIEDHKEKWASSVGSEIQHVREQEIKIAAAEKLEELKPLVRLALKDPGDHYDINNFKEHCIGLLCRDPALMLEYVRKEKDEWALALAANFSCDEGVLQAISDMDLKDSYASYKLAYLRMIGDVGLKIKDTKVQYWHDVLETVSDIGVSGLEYYTGGNRLTLAKLMILWRHHSGTHFAVHVRSAEVYDSWERCVEIAEKALQLSIRDVLSAGWSATETAGLRSYIAECAQGAYDSEDIKRLLRGALSDIYDEKMLKEAEEEALSCIDYVRFKTYSLEEERRDEVTSDSRSGSSEPPPWLDEFEYIDWQITH